MQRKKAIIILAVLIATGAILTAVASSGTTLTWEKTFDVKKPEIAAKIKIGEDRIVGFPVKIWVSLRIQAPSEKNQTDDRDHETRDWCHEIKFCNESIYRINGTYTANLLWFNTTNNQWQQLKTLQPETNITITCRWHTYTYVFTPTQEGQYKVLVTFTTASETQTFTSGD